MRIAVFGTGGAGGYFGARLAKAGIPVMFIARGEHLRAIQSNGLIVETPTEELRVHPAEATDDPSTVGPVDVVLLGVKAWQVPEAASAMRALVGPDTVVIPLQNGVDATRELASVLEADPVLAGLCGTISWVSAPGRIRSIGTSNFIRFGEQDNSRSRRVETILQTMVGAGINAEVPRDIHQALWTKFLVVTAVGGVGALSRAPIGVTRSLPETRKLLEACMREVRAVAIAHGINLPEAVIPGMMEYLDSLAPSSTTSLQRDIADGKRSELDYWNGAVVRLAADKNVAVPTHSIIYDLLLPLHRQAMGELTFPN